MAKEIKVIKCPQCGSTANTEIRPDFFRCSSCGTEYYLDNDDINTNYTVRDGVRTAVNPGRQRYMAFIFLGAAGLVTLISLLLHAMNVSRMSLSPASSLAGAGGKAKEEYSSWNSANSIVARGNAPLLVIVGKRNYSILSDDSPRDGIYLSFYDIVEKKELKAKKIAPGEKNINPDIQMRTFYNGDIYFTLDRKKVYRVDCKAFDAEEVTGTLFNGQPKLQTGIATVEFMQDNYGDGFSILTNDGASYSYYPLVDKIYTSADLNDAEKGFKSLINGGTKNVYFTFTAKGFDFPDLPIQLLRIAYKDNNGGPRDIRTNFAWRRDYRRSGSSTETDRSEKSLLPTGIKDAMRITDWKDLTPGRLYFDSRVIYGDSGSLLILFRANAAPDAPLSLQSLDPNTGSVKWTVACASDQIPDKAVPFRDGFILVHGNETQTIDSNGKAR